jgi:gentisate 1,2-dioxygenase
MATSAQLITAPPELLHNNGGVDLKEMELLRASMIKKHSFPMWKVANVYAKNRPHGLAVPTGWKFSEIKKDLMRSAELVPATESQRRVAMLVNPSFDTRRYSPV